jgi:hypothetical protein
MQLTKLEATQRQLETAVQLYFDYGDEVSIHTLVVVAYGIVRDVNKHRGGDSMIKDDLNGLLPLEELREFKKRINSPDNFLKHADRDPESVGELDPRWTEVLLWEACKKYCELSGTQNKTLPAFVFWFVANHPETQEQLMKDLTSQRIGIPQQIAHLLRNPGERRRFFALFQ